jgi:hypothetical protein
MKVQEHTTAGQEHISFLEMVFLGIGLKWRKTILQSLSGSNSGTGKYM